MRLAYISFDTVPAPKGAAIHIEAFTRALASHFGRIELVTVSGAVREEHTERWPGVFHTQLPGLGPSLIDRVLCFRACLDRWLRGRQLHAVQFRSIFEGFPLLRLNPRPRLIFEVNGLPCIELKYRYPHVADDRELMGKITAQEEACLQAADRIVTPSSVTRRYLSEARGIDASKILVIPNGVDPEIFTSDVGQVVRLRPIANRPAEGQNYPASADSNRSRDRQGTNLLYFGTLSQWQGVDLAVRALAQLAPQLPARLTIVGVGNSRQRAPIVALASKLGVSERVEITPPVTQLELVPMIQRSFAILAPLAMNDRNVTQGCCPLKVLEGMASGIPVIASDLPAVRELGEHGRHLLLVKPGSVDQIAQAVLQLHADPELWRRLSEAGRAHILEHYTWVQSGAALAAVWEKLGINRASSA